MRDLDRLNRYNEKMAIVISRIQYMEKWSEERRDEKTKFAIYKVGQESIEALTDIIAMICKDSNQEVKDDYANIECLEKMEILTEGQGIVIREANGLRNRLIHNYDNIDDELAMESLFRLKSDFSDIKEVLRIWIENLAI